MHRLFPDAELCETRDSLEATAAARDLASRYDTVIAVGGDGTVNSVINGLVGTDAALGLIPCGTGNVLAQALHIPVNDHQRAAEICLGTTTATIDLGRYGDRWFVASVGFGIDGIVVPMADRWKPWLGRGAFMLAAIAAQFRVKPWHVTVEGSVPSEPTREGSNPDVFGSTATHTLPNADTKDPNTRLLFEGEALLVAAVNAPKYGGWMRVSKETSISDGLLDLAVVRPGGVWKGGIMGPALAGSLATADRSRRVEVFRGTSFQIRCDAGPLCQIDGEPAPYLEAKVSVVANALRVKLGA